MHLLPSNAAPLPLPPINEAQLIVALESDEIDAVFSLFLNQAPLIGQWRGAKGAVWDYAVLHSPSWTSVAKLAAIAPLPTLHESFWKLVKKARAHDLEAISLCLLPTHQDPPTQMSHAKDGEQEGEMEGETDSNNALFTNHSSSPGAHSLSGYLYKWTNYATGWKKRFFSLTGPVLSYYKSKREWPAKPKASMVVGNGAVSVHRPHFGTDSCTFTLCSAHSPSSPKLHLRATSKEEALRWTLALEAAISNCSNSPLSSHPTASSSLEEQIALAMETLDALHLPEKEAGFLHCTLKAALDRVRVGGLESNPNPSSFQQTSVTSAEEDEEVGLGLGPDSEEEEFFDLDLPSAPAESSFASPAPEIVDPSLRDCYLATPARTTLPFRGSDIPKVSLWSFLRGVIGKDLTKLPVPVNYNEPLSMLQRMAEEMEEAPLLIQAAHCDQGSWKRLELVAAFAISSYASTDARLTKPFNPLLGETFEMCGVQGPAISDNWRYIAEQVSHHPPVSAFHAESAGFCYWGESLMKSKFRGKHLEVTPDGICHLYLTQWKEHYTWKKVNSCVQNILFGTMYIEHSGVMHIMNRSNGESCLIEFGSNNSSSSRTNSSGSLASASSASSLPTASPKKRLEGHVLAADGSILDTLEGYWNTYLRSDRGGLLWECRGDRKPDYYNFSNFTMHLNQPIARVAPTDSRNRPDQRALERGEVQEAQKHKAALEVAQRERRKHGLDWEPRWFSTNTCSSGQGVSWRFGGEYWSVRAAGAAGAGFGERGFE